jgi:hypothetical protein
MPINYIDIEKDIADIAAAYPQYQQELNARREAARQLFAGEFDQSFLVDKIRKAASDIGHLRCAVPTEEAINASFPLPEDAEEKIIIAVDGSQINPSRHRAINYFLLNVGILTFPARVDQTPMVKRLSKLFSSHSDHWKGVNENRIAYLRDLEERKVISEEAKIYGPGAGVLTLTDGPLELWLRSGDGPQSSADIKKALSAYLDSLFELKELGAAAAGYVDKPRAMLVVETLEIARLGSGELEQAKETKTDYHQFEGVTDSDLFAGILVRPGDRSAVFELQFSEGKFYKQKDPGLAMHFFYLNVSQEKDSPIIARVEVPGWVAADAQMIDQLQSALFHQCNILGDVRYPYVLERAHEEALVSFDDRDELERRIIEEFTREGIPVGTLSNKQSAKNLQTGKRRYSLGSRKY